MPTIIDPGHERRRGVLGFLSICLLVVGAVMTVIGMISFFSSFGSFSPPRYFWCAFIGLPLLSAGVALAKFAWLGKILRYAAGETAPVGKDVFNYMATETREGVEEVAAAVGRGIRRGTETVAGTEKLCAKCGAANEADAKFCRACGVRIDEQKRCGACGDQNRPDAVFCDNCGAALTA